MLYNVESALDALHGRQSGLTSPPLTAGQHPGHPLRPLGSQLPAASSLLWARGPITPEHHPLGGGGRRPSLLVLTFSGPQSHSLCCFLCPSVPSWGYISPQRVFQLPSLQLRPLRKMPRCEQRGRKRSGLDSGDLGIPDSSSDPTTKI